MATRERLQVHRAAAALFRRCLPAWRVALRVRAVGVSLNARAFRARRTIYLAEQCSHHPPVCAFYVQNRRAGFVGRGCIQFVSSFHGLYASSKLEGGATLTLTAHDNEEYTLTFPSAHARGFIVGPLVMVRQMPVCVRFRFILFC